MTMMMTKPLVLIIKWADEAHCQDASQICHVSHPHPPLQRLRMLIVWIKHVDASLHTSVSGVHNDKVSPPPCISNPLGQLMP